MLGSLYNSSIYPGIDNITFVGYKDFYMQKAAYVQTLVNLGLTVRSAFVSYRTRNQTAWKDVQTKFSEPVWAAYMQMIGKQWSGNYYSWQNSKINAKSLIDGTNYTAAQMVSVLADLEPKFLWQMEIARGYPQDPQHPELQLDIKYYPDWVNYWSISQNLTQSHYILGKMPIETGGGPDNSTVKDVVGCAQNTVTVEDIYQNHCVASALKYTGMLQSEDFHSQFSANYYHSSNCAAWTFKGLPCNW